MDAPAHPLSYDELFARFWQYLLNEFRSGTRRVYSPLHVGPGVGNTRRVEHMDDGMICLQETKMRPNNTKAHRSRCSKDKLREEFRTVFENSQQPVQIKADKLRARYGVDKSWFVNWVEFKRDLFEQFKEFCVQQRKVLTLGSTEMSKTRVPRIFLCYAKEWLPVVERLYDQLVEAGCRPWMDKRTLTVGELWQTAIPKAIREAEFFLACITHQFNGERRFLQREIKVALDVFQELPSDHVFVLPIRLEPECTVPPELSYAQWDDYFIPGGIHRLVTLDDQVFCS